MRPSENRLGELGSPSINTVIIIIIIIIFIIIIIIVFKEQEEEKKRKYQQRVLDVEMGSFTPLVFGTNGGMGNECQRLPLAIQQFPSKDSHI